MVTSTPQEILSFIISFQKNENNSRINYVIAKTVWINASFLVALLENSIKRMKDIFVSGQQRVKYPSRNTRHRMNLHEPLVKYCLRMALRTVKFYEIFSFIVIFWKRWKYIRTKIFNSNSKSDSGVFLSTEETLLHSYSAFAQSLHKTAQTHFLRWRVVCEKNFSTMADNYVNAGTWEKCS